MRRAAGIVAVAALAITISACNANGGLSLAQQACGHVARSLQLFSQSQHAPNLHLVSTEQDKAAEQLEQALPLAAQANSDGGEWNPLMTTLSELTRVNEAQLVPALRAECSLTNSKGYIPTPGSSPQNTPATPSTLPGQNAP